MRFAVLAAVLRLGRRGIGVARGPQRAARARAAYNEGRYDAAIGASRNAVHGGTDADAARVVLGRALLERYRRQSDVHDLQEAREALRAADASRLGAADRGELLVGLGQWLFYTDWFGPAAELFEVAADRPLTGGDGARDRVLDWWASALDEKPRRVRPAAIACTPACSIAWSGRSPRIPARWPRTTGSSRRRAPSVTSIARGRPRWRRGCGPPSRGSAAPPFARISIGSC